jgi:hypothetical protein
MQSYIKTLYILDIFHDSFLIKTSFYFLVITEAAGFRNLLCNRKWDDGKYPGFVLI